jgi:hypothetical protein
MPRPFPPQVEPYYKHFMLLPSIFLSFYISLRVVAGRVLFPFSFHLLSLSSLRPVTIHTYVLWPSACGVPLCVCALVIMSGEGLAVGRMSEGYPSSHTKLSTPLSV